MKLVISKDLSLPTDVVTQVIAILAKRRAGKSYTMRRIVEQLFKAQQQVVIIDPKGDQWGIRSSADGKKPGFPVLILGGEHGDLPLEVNGGEVVARLVVEQQVSVLLDVGHFRKHEVATFMTAFLENLYRLKALEKYRTPMMLVVDEADAIAPQKPQKGEERMLGAIEDIVRRGGQRGIGCTLVTQRSAVLNKNVLTQAQILVVLRTIAPQDLSAMKAWVDVHGTVEEGKVLMESLPSLPIGDAWFWSPGYPTDAGIFKRVHVSPIETFDSGATPKPGQKPVVPKNLADVDLEALKGQMSATIEKAKENDPKALRKQIATLTQQLADLGKQKGAYTPEELKKEIERAEVRAMQRAGLQWEKVVAKWVDYHARTIKIISEAIADTGFTPPILPKNWLTPSNLELIKVDPKMMKDTTFPLYEVSSPVLSHEALEGAKNIGHYVVAPEAHTINVKDVRGKTLELLRVLVSHYPNVVTRSKAALLAHIKVQASTFRNSVSKLKTIGFLEVHGSESLSATQAGIDYLGVDIVLPKTPSEAREHWRQTLTGVTLQIYQAVMEAYPNPVSREWIAEHVGIDPNVSTLRNSLSKLKTLGVVDIDKDTILASQYLFD